MSEALRSIGVHSEMIGQTVGNAEASAGIHLADGKIGGKPYCVCVDLRVASLRVDDIKTLMDRLGSVGFASWYRYPGLDHWPMGRSIHIHAVFSGERMKEQARHQVHDFCHIPTRNGLIGHDEYMFHQALPHSIEKVREGFYLSGNPIDD